MIIIMIIEIIIIILIIINMKEDHLCLLKANNREQELQFLNLAAAFF